MAFMDGAAIVYCGAPPAPDAWGWAFNTAWPVWLAMAAWAGATWAWAPRGRAAGAAWGGWGIGALLYLSPLCALSAAFFSVRVLHHLLLVGAVAPLLAWAGLQRQEPGRRPRVGIGAPMLALALVLWAWHAPAAYAWGLTTVAGYWLMQGTLLGAAWWFWREALRPDRPWTGAVAMLFASVAHMGLLGALIVFAGQLLYPVHAPGALLWGVAPLADQQLGGLLMWVPAIVPFMAAGLWRLARELRAAGVPA